MTHDETVKLLADVNYHALVRRLGEGFELCEPEHDGAVEWHTMAQKHMNDADILLYGGPAGGVMEAVLSVWMRPL